MLKKCNLRLLLDRPGETYRAGEAIEGAVELAPFDGIEHTVVTLTLQWKTDGPGDAASGEPNALTLYEGGMPPGRVQRYPFAFDAPAGPPTYHGHHLHVAWHLTAHAEIPWALDASETREIRLEGTAATPLAALFPQLPVGGLLDVLLKEEPETFEAGIARQQQADAFLRRGRAFLGLGKRVFHIAGSFMVFMGIAALIADPDVGIPLILFGAVFWGFSSFVFRMIDRFEAARVAPDDAGATATPALLRPGDAVALTVRLPADARVRRATATLRGEEDVSYKRQGADNRTETEHRSHTIHEQEAPLKTIRRATDTALHATFQLPRDAPSSFHAPHNALNWSIDFNVDLEGRPDPWIGAVALVVRP